MLWYSPDYAFSRQCLQVFTLVGMRLFLMAGVFQYKKLPQRALAPLAAAYVGYIVLCNLSLNVNTVGFYQVMKVRTRYLAVRSVCAHCVGAWGTGARRTALLLWCLLWLS